MRDSEINRRKVLAAAAAVAAPGQAAAQEGPPLYGLIGQMMAAPGKRDALIAILGEAAQHMPGCLGYIVAKDATHADAIWITEVWTDATHHLASLKLPAVQAAITRARPMITGFGHRFETVPVGGVSPAQT